MCPEVRMCHVKCSFVTSRNTVLCFFSRAFHAPPAALPPPFAAAFLGSACSGGGAGVLPSRRPAAQQLSAAAYRDRGRDLVRERVGRLRSAACSVTPLAGLVFKQHPALCGRSTNFADKHGLLHRCSLVLSLSAVWVWGGDKKSTHILEAASRARRLPNFLVLCIVSPCPGEGCAQPPYHV